MSSDNEQEQDFSDEEYRKMSEFFDQLAKRMDEVQPGFKQNYDEGIRVAGSFQNAVDYVIANHDIMTDALEHSSLQGILADLVTYLNIVYQAATKSKLASEEYFFDRDFQF